MNDIIQAMISRRSVRAFKPDQPDEALVAEVIRAGTFAASGRNFQSPVIINLTDPKLQADIRKLNAKIMGNPGMDPFYGAPVILIVLADRSRPTYIYDGSLVIGNMMLAAHSLGLGSCWIHRAKEEFETPWGKELLAKLGIKGDYEGIGHCALGYPAGTLPPPLERKPGYVYKI